jgi:hypothetical protein
MAKNTATRLLEISIVRRGPHSWEWRAFAGNEVLVCGFEASRMAARFAAYDMVFTMLAGGWC